MDRVQVVAVYPNAAVRSPGRSFELPSVIALREYRPVAGGFPAFTRFNLFLRDDFTCQVRGACHSPVARMCALWWGLLACLHVSFAVAVVMAVLWSTLRLTFLVTHSCGLVCLPVHRD